MEAWFFAILLDVISSSMLPLLSAPDIVHLDSACCSKSYRPDWITALSRASTVDIHNALKHATYELRQTIRDPAVIWLVNRGVRVKNLVIKSPATWKVVLAHPDLFKSVEAHGRLPSEVKESRSIILAVRKWKDGVDFASTDNVAVLTNLQSVEVWYTSNTAEAVHYLVSNNPGLTNLELICLDALRPLFFTALESFGPTLLRLSLRVGTPDLRVSDFECIGRCCPALQEFELSTTGEEDVWDPLDAWLLPIAQGCLELRDLRLDDSVSVDTIGRFVRNCTKLHTLNMWESDVDDAMLLALASRGAASLRVLGIMWAVWSSDTVQQSAPFLQGLESIEFSHYNGPFIKTLGEAVLHLRSVRSLTIHCEFDPSLLAGIAQGCPALRDLMLPLDPLQGDTPHALAQVFAKCVHLETVEISDVKVSDATLLALVADGAGRKLRCLDCGANGVTDVGLTALAVSCGSNLQEVSIYEGGALTDVALKAFSVYCPALQSLLLPKATAKITVEGVKELFSDCPRLRCVTVGAASLTQRQVYETLNQAQLPGRRKVVFAVRRYAGGTG